MKNKFFKIVILAVLTTGTLMAFDSSKYINNSSCNQVLRNDGFFTTCYDYDAKGAKFVNYILNADTVNKLNIKKRPRFRPDLNIPKKYRSDYSDYTKNIYHQDRGHMREDASSDDSQRNLNASYVMSNIIPQLNIINQGSEYWAGVERYSRYVAVKLGTVEVLNGVIYGNNPRRIGHNQIAVPFAYWKAIQNKDKDFEKCFYFENNKEFVKGKKSIKDFVVDCNKLMR